MDISIKSIRKCQLVELWDFLPRLTRVFLRKVMMQKLLYLSQKYVVNVSVFLLRIFQK